MPVKKCFKCGAKKPLSEFYKHAQMKDGHLNKCRDCSVEDVRNYRVANIEKIREYDRLRGKRIERVEAAREYAQRPEVKARTVMMQRERRKQEPEKYKAKMKVNNEIRAGRLVREPCEFCGTTSEIHAHHDDYSKPLDVRWMCLSCHMKYHKGDL